MKPIKTLLLEPYFTGSHKQWALGFQQHSQHRIEILKMSGHYWKWRMHGGAVTLAKKFMAGSFQPDLILATDMLDLTTFLALTREKTAQIPTAIYFHENQLTYPWAPTDRDVAKKRDNHYSFINYSSALAADRVFFNSAFHQTAFLGELKNFLKHFPDNNELASIEQIAVKSTVLPLGLDLEKFMAHDRKKTDSRRTVPLILWNHRWEHDKNPEEFFKALLILQEKGLDFEVAILGENFSKQPEVFENARKKLGKRIVHFGFCETFEEYAQWLWRADILPVTSIHDFFGASVVEAIFCECFPILPNRLAYPEHIRPYSGFRFYESFDELVQQLEAALLHPEHRKTAGFPGFVKKYDWKNMAPKYDHQLEKLMGS